MPLEAIFFAVVLAIALSWLAFLVEGRQLRVVVVGAAIVASLSAALGAIAFRTVPPPEQEVAGRPLEITTEGYVQSEACKSCHPSQHASWDASYHSSMTSVANSESVLGDFNDKYLEIFGDPYFLSHKGDEYFVDMIDPAWRLEHGMATTETPPRVKRKIQLTTGSHHMQVYWFTWGEDRTLGQLPFVWLVKEQEWTARMAAFLTPPLTAGRTGHEEFGRWNDTCLDCHTTRPRPRIEQPEGATQSRFKGEQRVEGSLIDTHVAEFGITCEACHGPAQEHIRVNQDPKRRYALHQSGDPDPTIVNPANLSAEEGSFICGQCHGSSELPDWKTWRYDGFTYKPGDDLTEHRKLITKSNFDDPVISNFLEEIPVFFPGCFWPDGMVRVAGREFNGLYESPCFKNGHGDRKLSCMSCHVMHKTDDDPRTLAEWTDDQLHVDMDGPAACLGCHEKYQDPAVATEHSHHAPDSAGNDCLNCHMPYSTYGLLKAIRSHHISSPNVAESVEGKRPNACNQCHLDKSFGWTGKHLTQWYGIGEPELDAYEEGVPASLIWLFQGDAAQRALVAWTMGWEDAQEASGNDWIGAYLPQLLMDSYDAVRFIALRSLRTLPGLENFQANVMAPRQHLERSAGQATQLTLKYRRSAGLAAGMPALIIDATGTLPPDSEVYSYLFETRDNTAIYLLE